MEDREKRKKRQVEQQDQWRKQHQDREKRKKRQAQDQWRKQHQDREKRKKRQAEQQDQWRKQHQDREERKKRQAEQQDQWRRKQQGGREPEQWRQLRVAMPDVDPEVLKRAVMEMLAGLDSSDSEDEQLTLGQIRDSGHRAVLAILADHQIAVA